MGWRFLAVLVLIATALWMIACQTTPYTERSQLILLSSGQEAELGLQAWNEQVGSAPRSRRADWTGMVQRSGQRIAAVADKSDFQWEFQLIAEPTVNAFCLPGGKVAFYEGIMPICQDETGVAVVMGHEVAHAIARHGGERVSQSVVMNAGTQVLAAILGGQDPARQDMVARALGVGTNVGLALPFSRDHESEADRIGLILMAKAGYDPRAAPEFWKRMSAQGGERGPEFLSTHPNPETRVEQLNAWIPEAMPYFERAGGKR